MKKKKRKLEDYKYQEQWLLESIKNGSKITQKEKKWSIIIENNHYKNQDGIAEWRKSNSDKWIKLELESKKDKFESKDY